MFVQRVAKHTYTSLTHLHLPLARHTHIHLYVTKVSPLVPFTILVPLQHIMTLCVCVRARATFVCMCVRARARAQGGQLISLL